MTSVIAIDDDPFVLEVICEYLELKNIDVLGIGHNGKKAVELYKKLRPDVVLLDVMMPEYDGFYGLQKIREFNPNAKIIMVTADLTLETENKLKELNVSAIAYKPYDLDSIIETIQKIAKKNKAMLSPLSED